MNKKLIIAALTIVGGLMGTCIAGVNCLKKSNKKSFNTHLEELPSVAMEFEDRYKDLSKEDAETLKSIYDGIESLEAATNNPKVADVEKLSYLYKLMGNLIDKYTEKEDSEDEGEDE